MSINISRFGKNNVLMCVNFIDIFRIYNLFNTIFFISEMICRSNFNLVQKLITFEFQMSI